MAALNNLRENLRVCCDLPDVTQRSVADKALISYVYLNRILQGHAVPTLPVAERLAKAVGVSLGTLIQSPKKFREALLTDVKQ